MQKSNHRVYIITEHTKAILASQSSYYRSTVLEGKNEFRSVYTPEMILDHSCILYGSTLHGRRKAIREYFGITSKIPLMIDARKAIYMMPTSSTRRKDCAWLSFYQIEFYEQRDNRCYVQFLDGTGIYLSSSVNTLDMQHKRTSQIIASLNRPSIYNMHYAKPLRKTSGSIL